MMQSISIKCRFTAIEDFHIGTGSGNIGLYDDGQHKDPSGNPVINSSTVKGLLRDSCDSLGRAKARFGLPEQRDLFNKLFVNFANLSSLDIKVSPVYPGVPEAEKTVIHYFTAVDNSKRTAKKGSLRSLEFGAKGLQFDLELNYQCNSGHANEISQYLVDGLKNIKAIGGHRRRGFGAISISDISHKVTDDFNAELPFTSGSKLNIIFELAEDTILSSKAQSGNMLSTMDYLPGTTILGMFRAVLSSKQSSSNYLDDGKVTVSFFYPMPSSGKNDPNIEICPAFLSFRKRKVYLTKLELASESYLSCLAPWALNSAASNKLADILCQNTMQDSESSDQGKGVNEGYIVRLKQDEQWREATYFKATKLYQQRNSIDPKKQSTSDSGIYIEEKLMRGTQFMGSICFANAEDCALFCRDFASWLNGSQPLHTGRGAKAVFVKHCVVAAPNSLAKASLDKDNCFTLSLLSDTILYSDTLQSCTMIDPTMLALVLGEPYLPKHFELLSYASRSGVISSFSGTSGLRKFRDIAIRKGSCFRFKYLGTAVPELQQRLTELMSNGIGFRKQEGFGIISINHPLHEIYPQATTSNKPILAESLLPQAEHKRLSNKASMYIAAEAIADELNKARKDKWTSMAADVLVQIESDIDLTKIKERLKVKLDSNSPGAWGEKDSRSKIATILIKHIDSQTPRETIATALKLMLASKGGVQ